MPQKTRLIDILSRKWRFDARNVPAEGPWRLQIDKMSKKEIFAAVCVNEKKAVTLSVLKKPYKTNNTIHYLNNF